MTRDEIKAMWREKFNGMPPDVVLDWVVGVVAKHNDELAQRVVAECKAGSSYAGIEDETGCLFCRDAAEAIREACPK